MIPLVAHVVMHVMLCGSMSGAAQGTPIVVAVKLSDHSGIQRLAQTFKIERGDDNQNVVEFDVPAGTFLMEVNAPKYGCTSSTFQHFLDGHDRVITVTLEKSPPTMDVPVLLEGFAPTGFLYAHPEFVLLPKDTPCKGPVGDPLPSQMDVESDSDAFYAWLYEDHSPNAPPAILALRLRTPTHRYHYVRMPIPYPLPPSRFPSNVHFDVTQDMIDGFATEPTGVLLCPKIWETKVYS